MRKVGKVSYDPKNIIGTGGFANVYEGLFEDVKRVAVKRFEKKTAKTTSLPSNEKLNCC